MWRKKNFKVIILCLFFFICLVGLSQKATAACEWSFPAGDFGNNGTSNLSILRQNDNTYLLKLTNPVYHPEKYNVYIGSEDMYYPLKADGTEYVFTTRYGKLIAEYTIYKSKPTIKWEFTQSGTTKAKGTCANVQYAETYIPKEEENVVSSDYVNLDVCKYSHTLDDRILVRVYLRVYKNDDGSFRFVPVATYKTTTNGEYYTRELKSFDQNTQYQLSETLGCSGKANLVFNPTTKKFSIKLKSYNCLTGKDHAEDLNYHVCTIPNSYFSTPVTYTPMDPCGAEIKTGDITSKVSITQSDNSYEIPTYQLKIQTPTKSTMATLGTANQTWTIECAKLTTRVSGINVYLMLDTSGCNLNKTYSHMCSFPAVETTLLETTVLDTTPTTTTFETTTSETTHAYSTTVENETIISSETTTTETTSVFETSVLESTTPVSEITSPYMTTQLPETILNIEDMCNDFCDEYADDLGW